MPAWSFGSLRPKLDRFFEHVRHALEARADSGVDRRRLEDFLTQTHSLQERLYACLASDERSELPLILKDIQVLAYRTRVLFGSPLPGVAWDDVQSLLLDVPMPAAPAPAASRVLEGAARTSVPTRDLTDSRRQARLPERTLVAPAPAVLDSVLTSREVTVALDPSPLGTLPLGPLPLEPPPEPPAGPGPALASLIPLPAPPAEVAQIAQAVSEPDSGASLPEATEAPGWALPRWPALLGVLIFLLGAIAGSTLGGLHPPLTAMACGILAIAVARP